MLNYIYHDLSSFSILKLKIFSRFCRPDQPNTLTSNSFGCLEQIYVSAPNNQKTTMIADDEDQECQRALSRRSCVSSLVFWLAILRTLELVCERLCGLNRYWCGIDIDFGLHFALSCRICDICVWWWLCKSRLTTPRLLNENYADTFRPILLVSLRLADERMSTQTRSSLDILHIHMDFVLHGLRTSGSPNALDRH